MTDSGKAVFLSYASQDAEAALRICTAMRNAGIEVWFDQSELRGGDAWDGAIRRQIKNCALFIPVISRNTHAREEGYFRLEWKLAVDRSHLMTSGKKFLLPVVVDDTRDDDEHVPDKFRELQWTRLPAGETPPAFVERVLRLVQPAEPVATIAPQPATGATPLTDSARAVTTPVPPLATSKSAASWRSKSALLGVIAVILIVLGILAVTRFVPSKRVAVDERASVSVAQPAAPGEGKIPEKSIAVLPFLDLSEKQDQGYFSDGLTEELLDLLAQVPDLRVAARTSSFYFKGKQATIANIAQTLGVAHVLEGSVRKAGSTLRVTAQLIRADNGYHLWSQTYDRDIKDIFQVQDQIAGAVVAALKIKLLAAQQITNPRRTANTEAYTQYLLGNELRTRDTPESNRQALAAYQQAIALDPTYAVAYAGLSDAEWRLSDQLTGDAAGYQRAIAAADRAIALAPELADGYLARGNLRLVYFWDWSGAQADFEKALALDPNNARVQVNYALLLAALGHMQDAIAAMTKATELDPMWTTPRLRLGILLMNAGQIDAARQQWSRALQINPDAVRANFLVALQILRDGRAQDALAAFRKVGGPSQLMGVAMAEHTLGHARESQQALEPLIKDWGRTFAWQIAEVYAWRGDKDHAFEWLDRAYGQRDGGMIYLKYEWQLSGLRDDPRYRALLTKVKLPQ